MKRLARSPSIVAAALALLALAYRLVLLRTALGTVDSDQAVLGIMARHVLRGERPLFFYGQGYGGALEAYLTAGVFRLWGQSDLTLRLVPALVSAMLVAQLYGLARRLYSPAIALAAGLWLALPPPVLLLWGTAAGAGYIEVTVVGTALLAIAIRHWGLGESRGYDLPALGLLAGFGLWLQPMMAYYLVTLATYGAPMAWRWLRTRPYLAMARRAGPVAAAFIVGAAPWLAGALRHRGAGLTVLAGHLDPAMLPDTVRRLGTQALPLLAGGGVPSTSAADYTAYIAQHALPYLLALLALCYVVPRLFIAPGGLSAQARALLAGHPLPDAPLALLPLVTLALYLASRFEALEWTTHNPRYLLPLYSAVPYLMACAVPGAGQNMAAWRAARPPRPARTWPGLAAWMGRSADRWRHWGGVPARAVWAPLLAVALAVNVYGSAQFQAPPRVTRLAATLIGRHDGAVYCLYWLAWRLAFESGERILPVVTRGVAVDPRANANRYPPYLAHATQARRWAYILPYDIGAPVLIRLLRRDRVPYSRWRWGNASVFDGPMRAGFPPGLAQAVVADRR